MLDTNTASFLVSGRSPAARRTYLDREPNGLIALSSIAEAELRFGLEKKVGATRLRSAFELFFATVTILPWTSQTAQVYGKLRATLNATGMSLAFMDLLIAAHAIATNAILVTHDQAFRQLTPVLSIKDWATDL